MTAPVAVRTPTGADLGAALGTYIAGRRGRPVVVDGLRRLAGGTSHETWAFDAHDPAEGRTEALVLRRDFDHRPLDSDLGTEFDLLRDLRASGLPVPRPYWCEVDDSPLGLSFMVLERVAGTDIRKTLAGRGRAPERAVLGEELVRLQADVHAAPLPAALGEGAPPAAEVEHWATAIAAASSDPGPLITAALARLRGHAPAPGRPGLVHGDFKTNNLLFGADGTVTVLDWELAHIGDPVEDLAWTMLWTTGSDLVGGLLTSSEYVLAYEQASGHAVDPERLAFWRLLALVKLAAIFLTGVATPRDGRPVRPTLLLLGRSLAHLEHDIAGCLRAALAGGAR
ncbi:phosphotransferase family protein [Streptomyces sp. cg40]|uniref:phosphotransferase family protein n=1 Tax=Streptomyces sp. cg40 TaxID=3419764 RepID=UPI003CFE7D4A